MNKRLKIILLIILICYILTVLIININLRIKIGRPFLFLGYDGWFIYIKYNDGGKECTDGEQCLSKFCAVVSQGNLENPKGECYRYSTAWPPIPSLTKGKVTQGKVICIGCAGSHRYPPWTSIFIFPSFLK